MTKILAVMLSLAGSTTFAQDVGKLAEAKSAEPVPQADAAPAVQVEGAATESEGVTVVAPAIHRQLRQPIGPSGLRSPGKLGPSIDVGKAAGFFDGSADGPSQALLVGGISGKAGSGPGFMYARDLAKKGGFVLQASPGYFRMGGKEEVLQEKPLAPGMKQQVVLKTPAVTFIPAAHVVYAPKSIGRVRPGVGVIGGVAHLSELPSVSGRVVKDGLVVGQSKIKDIEVPQTRVAAAITVGAAIRADSTGKKWIDTACGFFPGGFGCAGGLRW